MDKVEDIVNLIVDCLKKGGKVITFGVGGNAANAIHFAAELAGKFEQYEEPLPCICLCENPSVLTAITNDFGWDYVFSRQIEALAKPEDVVVGFSISTNGQYLFNTAGQCVDSDCTLILICGRLTKGIPGVLSNLVWELESDDTPWVQEEQLKIIHKICRLVKERMEKPV